MPTKKKKQTSSRLGRGDGSWLSNAFDKGMLLHFYRDRGMGLQPFIEEGIRPFNKIKSFKHLETFLKKIRMDPATAHEILDKFLFIVSISFEMFSFDTLLSLLFKTKIAIKYGLLSP